MHLHPAKEAHAEQRNGHIGAMNDTLNIAEGYVSDTYRIQANFPGTNDTIGSLHHCRLTFSNVYARF